MTSPGSLTAPLAIVRLDADRTKGGGHAIRCLALAERLRWTGWRMGFAAAPETTEVVPALRETGCDVLELTDGPEPARIAARWPEGADLLIVDHDRLDAVFESACRPWARRILVVDDLADRPHDADLLLDQTPGRTAADYRGLTPAGCTLLLGEAYALPRPEFAQARTAAAPVDGGGAWRVTLALAGSLPGKDGVSVHLRLATEADRDLLYSWQAQESVRRFARNPAVPTWAEHCAWFARAMADPDRLLTIIRYGTADAGMLRFDRLGSTSRFEVSILVTPDLHGRSIARTALLVGQRVFVGAHLHAHVKPENTASQRLFQSAGFHPVSADHLEWHRAADRAPDNTATER